MKGVKYISFLISFFILLFISCNQEDVWQEVNQFDSPAYYLAVLSTSPLPGETYVQINSGITIIFNDNIDQSTLSDSTISVNNGVAPASIDYDAVTKTVTYEPQDILTPNTTYTVVLSKDIRNLAGEGLASDYIWSFTTASDLVPEIVLYKGIVPIYINDIYDFGTILYTATRVATFSITNTGSANLTISSIDLGGLNPSDFSTSTVASPVLPGNSAAFTVTFNPTSTGIKNAMITINNNDDNESSYTFNVTGMAAANPEPEIMLRQGTTEYVVGDNYDFGTIPVETLSPAVTFTIYNIGNTNLYIDSITLDGPNMDMFIVDDAETSTIVAPESSTTFIGYFAPNDAKVVLVKVLIANNDNDENPFMFKFKGRGVADIQ